MFECKNFASAGGNKISPQSEMRIGSLVFLELSPEPSRSYATQSCRFLCEAATIVPRNDFISEVFMAQFQVLNVSLELIQALRPVLTAIAHHDRDLASQLKRSGSSIPLNISEGARRAGRDRLHSYRIAAGSAAEARTTLAVAREWGYVDSAVSQTADDILDRILAMLWRLTH